MAFRSRQMVAAAWPWRRLFALGTGLEKRLESERSQLPLWAPVALGTGICAWFALPTPRLWLVWVLACFGLAFGLGTLARGGRLAQALMIGAALAGAGCLLPWARATWIGQAPLARAATVEMRARVLTVEPLIARNAMRLTLAPVGRPDLPAKLRVNAAPDQLPAGLGRSDEIALRARLMPPPAAQLPGGYDFARQAYFAGLGATGRVLGSVQMVDPVHRPMALRLRLAAHVRAQLPGPAGTIAATLATGERSGISQADAAAMRRSGLAHLLSISGLHVAALIGGVTFLIYRLLALSPRLALRWPLILIAACAGALAGVGYTWLTGMHVPTVRACIAALLVIAGLALGREAISLRLIAVAALVVMLIWPESLIGPSFQMSFAAVIAIVALYEWPPARHLFERRQESRMRRLVRGLGALFATGLLVEIVLMPIALYHFHRVGLLGALANLIAIPLTSFVIMPAEALALLLDSVGLGAPAWAVTGAALRLLLAVAHHVAALPFAAFATPAIGGLAYGVTMASLLWMLLWRTHWRWLGAVVALAGTGAILMTPASDVLVSADGSHVAVRMDAGGYALLRPRTGDYMRSALSEAAGYEGELAALPALAQARCSDDMCAINLASGNGGTVALLATRSNLMVPYAALIAACARADIVVSNRFLPRACRPRWLRLDRRILPQVGGVLINLADSTIMTGRAIDDRHPWIIRPPLWSHRRRR